MRNENARWQDLARLENLAERCAAAGTPEWLCRVLRDSVDWNRKWLLRSERLGVNAPRGSGFADAEQRP